MATLAAVLGIDPPATSEGIAFLGPHAAAFSRPTGYHQFYKIHRGIRTTDDWKLIGYRAADGDPGAPFYRVQLFDLAADPYELNDLSAMDAYQSKLSALQSLLAGERARYDDPLRP